MAKKPATTETEAPTGVVETTPKKVLPSKAAARKGELTKEQRNEIRDRFRQMEKDFGLYPSDILFQAAYYAHFNSADLVKKAAIDFAVEGGAMPGSDDFEAEVAAHSTVINLAVGFDPQLKMNEVLAAIIKPGVELWKQYGANIRNQIQRDKDSRRV